MKATIPFEVDNIIYLSKIKSTFIVLKMEETNFFYLASTAKHNKAANFKSKLNLNINKCSYQNKNIGNI